MAASNLPAGKQDKSLAFYDVSHGLHSRLAPEACCSTARQLTERLLTFYDARRTTWWQTIQLSPTHQIEMSLALRLQDACASHGITLRGGPDRSKVDVGVHIAGHHGEAAADDWQVY